MKKLSKNNIDLSIINARYQKPIDTKLFDNLLKEYKNIFIFAHNEDYRNMWRWAIKHNKNVNYGFLNRPSAKTMRLVEKTKEEILSGYVSDKSYFYLIDPPFMKTIEEAAKANPDVQVIKDRIKNLDGFYILEYSEDLMKEKETFEEVKIAVKHRYWEDTVVQISKYRAYRNVDDKFTDYATIVNFDDKELILKWDKYGIEEFEKKDDGKYHQRVKE